MSFDAYVTAALFEREGAAWALGDGTVRFEGGRVVEAHDGAVLAAAAHPSGEGVVTGGDDGRLVWSRAGEGAVELADAGGRWIDAVAASAASGLIAFAAGRALRVLDAADPKFERVFAHGRTVAGLAFDAKGRRLATATYGGAALWWARIADQKPQMLKWAGSHVGVAWSPDGRFLFSAMQENALHGWRVSDGKDMRMGGYPSKIRSLAFAGKGGQLLVTSGAPGAVVWPIGGPKGPMGKEAAEIGFEQGRTVTEVAAVEGSGVIGAGCDDGRVWTADLASRGIRLRREPSGSPVSALAMAPKSARLAWGDEAGGAGVVELA